MDSNRGSIPSNTKFDKAIRQGDSPVAVKDTQRSDNHVMNHRRSRRTVVARVSAFRKKWPSERSIADKIVGAEHTFDPGPNMTPHRTFVSRRKPRRASQTRYFESLESRRLLAADLVISEFMASNRATIDDGNGRSSDWIEIFNRGDEAADLSGWYLTDDLENLDRWRFPEIQMEPGEYAVVFASGYNQIDQDGVPHTNFKLSSRGETLALVNSSKSIAQQIKFPKQYTDVSFGFSSAEELDRTGYMSPPTPGAANSAVRSGVTEATVAMSKESGVFTESFTVDLTTDSDSPIYYTLDGSLPDATSAIYSQPIEISQSTQIRAMVIEPAKVPGPTKTESFSKLSAQVAEFSSDISMMVIDNYGAGDIPNTGWNQTNAGIQQLPRQAANLMLFEADEAGSRLNSTADVSSRIGIRIRGAFSSTFAQPGLSVETWSDSADVDQEISPLGIAADSDWVLYAPNPQHDETLIDNSFLFELSNQMGQWAPEVRYVETFVNTDGGDVTMDDFVGMYVITEKIKRTPDRINFEELALDGSSGGWLLDVNRLDPIALDGSLPKNFHTAGPDGVLRTRRDLRSGSSLGDDIPRQQNAYINYDDPSGLSINPVQRDAISGWFDEMESVLYSRKEGVTWNDPVNGYAKYIDVDNFIDYFILHDLSHNGDGLLISLWVYNSDPNGDGKLKFGPIWDADLGSYTGVATAELMRRKTQLWYGQLFKDPNFNLRYAERWQELRQTVLSESNMSGVIDQFYANIGDEVAVRDNVRNWRSRLDRMQTWLADRAVAIDQLFVPAPQLSQDGGEVPAGFELSILSEQGDVYYTLDGTDPRAADGTVSPNAKTVETGTIPIVQVSAPASILVPDAAAHEQISDTWTSPDFIEGAAGESWTAGTIGVGFDDRGAYDELLETDLGEFTDLSMYVRIPFEVSNDQLSEIKKLVLQLQYDDGFVAYLNGTEVARSNVPGAIGEPIPFGTRAARSHRARPMQFDSFRLDHSALRVGTNYLAIQGLNRSTSGGDLLIRPELHGVTIVSPPIIIREPTDVFARTRDEEEWSGATRADFTVAAGLRNDLNRDGEVNVSDIDWLCAAIHLDDEEVDLNDDGAIDMFDLRFFVRQQLGTHIGDVNLDGVFNSGDLVKVFQAAEYEDDLVGNSTWATGDWNCDGEFSTRDLVFAFQ
ncbi:CotH kinase family protein [Planctomycetota bacterium]